MQGATAIQARIGCSKNLTLLGRAQLLPVRIRASSLLDGDGSLQGEIQHRLRGQFDLLGLTRGLHASAYAGPGCSSDRGSFPAAGNRADNAADDGAAANFFSGVFTS